MDIQMAVLGIGRQKKVDTILSKNQPRGADTDILLDIRKMTRYVSILDTRYDSPTFGGDEAYCKTSRYNFGRLLTQPEVGCEPQDTAAQMRDC